MATRYPLVVNSTTNQITEIQINDDLQLDDTELTTSTGDLLLNPAGEINCMKALSNSGGDVIVNDSLKVQNPVGIQTNAVSTKSLTIGTTWNGASTEYHGIHVDITNTASDAASKLLQLKVGGTNRFDVDVDGNTKIEGTLTADGNALFNGNITLNADNKNFKIQLDDGTDKFTVASDTGNTAIVGDLDVDGNTTLDLVTIAETLTLSSGLDANSTANFQGEVTFQDAIIPSGNISIGTSSAVWGAAHIGNITIANGATGTDDETITTVNSKDLILTSNSGTVKIDGKIVATSDSTSENLRLTSTDGGTTAAPDLILQRNSSSPTDLDFLGNIRFTGENSNDDETLYARMYAQAVDVTDATEDGKLIFDVISDGTNTEAMTIDGSGVEITGNLTVQGTTTQINTTTLKVEDNVIELRKGNSITAADGGIQVNLTTDNSGNVLTSRTLKWNNDAAKRYWQVTAKDGNDYAILTEGLPIKVISTIEDIDLNSAGVASGSMNYDVIGRNVNHFAQGDATSDIVLNVRGDASTTFANHCAAGESVTISFIIKNGNTARKVTSLQIDGTGHTIQYANATTPVPPPNQKFIYTFTIIRLPDSGGNANYDIYGTGTAYA
tara:strand:- start:1178 stop:3013 length:1836 start_codon:yes stop_codon:yes gene_type:complete